jgi:hypothetical protein
MPMGYGKSEGPSPIAMKGGKGTGRSPMAMGGARAAAMLAG